MDDRRRAHIIRLYEIERFPIGTIARELGVHHSTVKRVLDGCEVKRQSQPRPCAIERYRDFIEETLRRHPRITGSRLFQMVKARGYPGGADHFRHQLAKIRPRREREAFLRLRVQAGEEGASGLGALRQGACRVDDAEAACVSDGAVVLARDPPSLLLRSEDGELPAWSPVSLRLLRGRPASHPLRQLEERGARAHRNNDRLQPGHGTLRRHVELRGQAGRGLPGQRKGPGRKSCAFRTQQLLASSSLHVAHRAERRGGSLGSRSVPRSSLAGRLGGHRPRGPRQRARDAVAVAWGSRSGRRRGHGEGVEVAVRSASTATTTASRIAWSAGW